MVAETTAGTGMDQGDIPEATPDPLQLCRYLTERSPLPVAAAEGLTHIVRYVNPAFCRLVGKANEELIGSPFALAIPEGEENGCLSLLDRVYHTGEAETLSDQEHFPLHFPRDLHPTYWSYAVWATLDAEEHPTGVMIQITNTTASTRNRLLVEAICQALVLSSVRHHELLELSEGSTRRLQQAMRETDHRVKNNWQTVVGLLELQTQTDADTVPVQALTQVRTCIKALLVIHDMLVLDVQQDPTARVMPIVPVLQKLIPMLQQAAGQKRITWYADEVRLPIKHGMSLAILINELVTNAIKHGGTTVEIRLTTSQKTVTLEVSDNGPGFGEAFDPKKSANYGLELVESICRVDLRGVTTYSNRSEGGASMTITFPLPAEAYQTPTQSTN